MSTRLYTQENDSRPHCPSTLTARLYFFLRLSSFPIHIYVSLLFLIFYLGVLLPAILSALIFILCSRVGGDSSQILLLNIYIVRLLLLSTSFFLSLLIIFSLSKRKISMISTRIIYHFGINLGELTMQ